MPAPSSQTPFTPIPVIPGDDLTPHFLSQPSSAIKLGPGIHSSSTNPPTYTATLPGILTYLPSTQTFLISTPTLTQSRPQISTQLIGIITGRQGDYYTVNCFASTPYLLNLESFDGATRRNRPNLSSGSVIFCRVLTTYNGGECQGLLTCCTGDSEQDGGGGSTGKKDWMTGEALFGPLKGGYLINNLPIAYAQTLLSTNPIHPILNELSAFKIPFETCIGSNGAVWVNSDSVEVTLAVTNCIKNGVDLEEREMRGVVRGVIKGLGISFL